MLQATEWRRIRDKINAAFVFARANLVSVHQRDGAVGPVGCMMVRYTQLGQILAGPCDAWGGNTSCPCLAASKRIVLAAAS
jgi:hypothetical protein